jgi:DNA polymerase-3 subunit gamma/tau
MYQVLARKWRPKSFEELVGQQHIARALRNALEQNRLAHAYIFAGLRGIGKTTVARILAKCLNCEQGPTSTPCDRCSACREIAESRSIDVLEMDAASRTGVNDIREVQEVVSYAPVRDRYKILIIDEAHMLSKNAFNALLKTLEEPPPQVVFVLATTELQKILPTILSRCQVFEFRRVNTRELVEHLRKLCDAEKIKISDHALERIARAGEGSVRDSLSVLERVLAFAGTEVDDRDALQVMGAVRHEILVEMMRSLAARDAAGMLTVLDALVTEGHDLVHFWSEFVAVLRDVLVARALPDRTELWSRTPEEIRALQEAVGDLTDEDLVRAFQVVADLEPGLKASGQPRFLFEATLIRLASLGSVRPIEDLLATLGTGGPVAESPKPRPRRPPPRTGPSRGPQKKSAEAAAPVEEAAGPARGYAPPLFSSFVAGVQEAKPMLGAMLEQVGSAVLEGDTLVLHLGEAAAALRRRLEDEDSMRILRRCASEAAGQELGVRVASIENDTRGAPAGADPRPESPSPPPDVPKRGMESRGTAKRGTASRGTGDRGSLLERAKKDPGIKKLLHDFGAQVVDIRPLDAPPDAATADSDAGPVKESS